MPIDCGAVLPKIAGLFEKKKKEWKKEAVAPKTVLQKKEPVVFEALLEKEAGAPAISLPCRCVAIFSLHHIYLNHKHTARRRGTGRLNLQVSFRKRATNQTAFLRKMTRKD